MKSLITLLALLCLTSGSFLTQTAHAAQDIVPSIEVGSEYLTDESGKSLLFRVDFALHRGALEFPEVQPHFYLARLRGAIGQPLVDLEFIPYGVEMEDNGNALHGEALKTQIIRDIAQDENFGLTVSVISGGAQAALPWWLEPGQHDLFLGILIDALGYKLVQNFDETFSGMRVGKLAIEAGTDIYTRSESGNSLPIRIALGIEADYNLDFAGNSQSDQRVYLQASAQLTEQWRLLSSYEIQNQMHRLRLGLCYRF